MNTYLVNQSEVDALANMAATLQGWMVVLGWNAQLYHFNQEYLKVSLGGDLAKVRAMLGRWEAFIAPHKAQRDGLLSASSFITIEMAEPILDIQVVR